MGGPGGGITYRWMDWTEGVVRLVVGGDVVVVVRWNSGEGDAVGWWCWGRGCGAGVEVVGWCGVVEGPGGVKTYR